MSCMESQYIDMKYFPDAPDVEGLRRKKVS